MPQTTEATFSNGCFLLIYQALHQVLQNKQILFVKKCPEEYHS